MFRTKKDVDHHVQDIFRKLLDDNERTARCYKIAELYHHVGDNDSARRYLSRYIDRYKEAKAFKLLGQILESLGQKEDALVQYKRAFELNSKHDELVLRICKLMADPEVEIDVNHAKYWTERAENLSPCPSVVFQLKEKILSIERPSNNEEDLEKLILSELGVRPSDVQLRIKLLNHYMETNKFEVAYKHATDIEVSNIYRDSLPWYKVLCELFSKCKSSKQQNWSFWISYMSSLERYAALTLKELGSLVKNNSEAIQAVNNLDQNLFEFKAQSFTSYPALTESVVQHMWGQLHLHMACLLIQNAKREQSSWNEAARLCAPLFLHAVHIKPIDLSASWTVHIDNTLKKQLQVWYHEGSYRCSQAGHILYDLSEGNQNKLIDSIEKFCTGSWRERLYQRIFVSQFHQKTRTSYFTNNTAENTPHRLVSFNELKKYNKAAEEVYPQSLHHQIWPAVTMCNSNSTLWSKDEGPQPNLSSHLFPELSFSVYNVNQTSSVTLCRLDVDAFLNAAVICASAVVKKQRYDNLSTFEKLRTVPADLTNPLCTEEQEKWWKAAYKMYCKENLGSSSDVRQNLQRGLEVVRCIGNHGLHPVILVHLARVFQYRARKLKEKNSESGDILALESRSELYWAAAVPLLERMQNNHSIRSTGTKLFEYVGKEMNNMELTHAIEEGKLLLAQKLVRDKLYEQAIEALQMLKCPEASFEQGKIYKTLADETLSSLPKESVTSEMRSRHIIILSKARNCFYLTLDRLRSPDADPKHPLNSELCTYITLVENELKRIDPDIVYNDRLRNDCDNVSEESYSSAHSDEHPAPSHSFPAFNSSCLQTPMRNVRRNMRQSTPRASYNHDESSRLRVEARPSPERLDAQIRQLIHSIESLKEQNREHNRAVMAKLDELMKNNSKDTRKSCSDHNNLEGDYYGLYGENSEEFARNYNNYNAMNPTPSLAQNLFNQRQQPYAHLMYPPPTALQSYYQGGPLTFPDSTGVGNPLATGLYPAYPMSPLYRPVLEQPIASIQQMAESTATQQGLFGQRLSGGLQDYQTPQPLQLGLQTKTSFPTVETSKPPSSTTRLFEAPVNVVITSSDTLPTTVSPVQSTLSVTIPPQHRLGSAPVQDQNAPHGYQIPMPTQSTIPTTVNLPPLTTTFSSPGLKSLVAGNQNTSNLSDTRLSCSSDNTEVEHDPIPDFKPVIPLPDEVLVTTGEEDEETLFCARAKLFRFVDKEWKERGVGLVKLLKNAEGKVRLLMRREQILKICANHMLRKDMELSPMPNNDKAYIWVANDFADEEVKLEKLCIRFKTPEEASSFRDNFENAKKNLPESTESSSPAKLEKPPKVVEKPRSGVEKKAEETNKPSPFSSFSFGKSFCAAPETNVFQNVNKPAEKKEVPASQKPLSELFKPAAGSWECQDCYTRNDKSVDACKACNGPSPTAAAAKPVVAKPAPKPASTLPPADKSLFEKFKPAPGSWECQDCYTRNDSSKQYCNACEAPKDSTVPPKPKTGGLFASTVSSTTTDSTAPTFTFGIPAGNKESTTPSFNMFANGNATSNATSTPGSIFGVNTAPTTPSTGFVFGKQTETTGDKKDGGFAFGSPGKPFQFQFQPKSPNNKSTVEASDDEVVEESEDVYFTPVVPLPDKIDVKTGEENEEVLFSHRAKLFKYDTTNKTWKERGLGDIKLLKHKDTKKLRLVMRRDQVLKLCLNHVVNAALEIKTKDDKTWWWTAADFSDGEVEYMQFACRFKTPEIANDFKKAVDDACDLESKEPPSLDKLKIKEPSPEIEVVFETNVTPEQKAAAAKLKLPENFYSYESKPDCTGCIGCQEPEIPLFKVEAPKPSSVFSFKPTTTTTTTTTPTGSLFAPAIKTEDRPSIFSFGNAAAPPKTPGLIFGGVNKDAQPGSIFGGANKDAQPSSIFGGANKDAQTGSIFGGANKDAQPGSIFGGVTANKDTQPGLIFGAKSADKKEEMFGNSIFGGGDNKQEPKSVFGNSIPSTGFLAKREEPTLFSGSGNISFSSGDKKSEDNKKEPKSLLSNPIFGDANKPEDKKDEQKPLFGSPIFGDPKKPEDKKEDMKSLFGNLTFVNPKKPEDKKEEEQKPLFGNSIFGDTKKPPSEDTSRPISFLPIDDSLTFSALAVQTAPDQMPAFKADPNFKFDGAGASVFGAGKSPGTAAVNTTQNDSRDESQEDAEATGEEYDPYFEPIIPLPDAIEVRTGEEDEQKIFCERGKLFRYDQNTKEWKERGIGEMKLLYGASHGTYRLLLRREQVYKVVCNLLLTPDIEFMALNSSDRAWMWAGMNYADSENPEIEKLAVRFKNQQLALQFKEAIDKAQEELERKQNS